MDAISQTPPMLRSHALSLPPSLQRRFGSLPVTIGSLLDRVGRGVSNYLILKVFSMGIHSIFREKAIFLPAFPVRQGGANRARAAGDGVAAGVTAPSSGLIGVLSLAQHHADRSAGQVEILAQCVDEIAPIGIRELPRL
jgi:hypothetical protein